jgi:hypothetical protein
MILTIIILSIIIVVLGYTTWNLLVKNEKLEDTVVSYDEYFLELNNAISEADKRLKKVDERGLFKSDDEIGWFFTSVKEIQNSLNVFKLKKNA